VVCEREKENSEIESASSTGCFSVESDFVDGIFVSAASIFPFVHHRLRLSLLSCLRRSCTISPSISRESRHLPITSPRSLPLATTPFNSRSTLLTSRGMEFLNSALRAGYASLDLSRDITHTLIETSLSRSLALQ